MRTLLLSLSASCLCVAFAACGGGTSTSLEPSGDGGSSGSSSGGGDGGSGSSSGGRADGGGSSSSGGSIGPNGGSVALLNFAVVGDTRPGNQDDVAGYPTAIITKIYQDIEALNPRPPFVLSTGDYQYSSTNGSSTAAQQMNIYMMARSLYSGLWFPAMGNHECTGATASNCGPGTSYGMTTQYNEFLKQMLGPIQKTLPYYSINVNAEDGSWTSKFVFVAANAWDSAQQSWLETTMQQKTTYTFVIRHEPATTTNGPPGESASESIISQYPYTLVIVGHSHTYDHYSTPNPRQALLGNGGAPISGSGKDYGFGTFVQRADGAIVCDEVDYMTGAKDGSYHFVVKPDGTLTQ